MKAIGFVSTVLLVSVAFSQTTKVSAKSARTSTVNSSAVAVSATPAVAQSARVHVMTNMVGLVQSQPNVQAHFFGKPQAALTIGFLSSSEKTEPLKKTTTASQITVNKAQYSVGGAYYFSPTENETNFVLNPFLLTQKKSDVLDVESSVGLGLAAMGLYRSNNFSLTFGGQSTFVAGESIGSVNAGLGFIY